MTELRVLTGDVFIVHIVENELRHDLHKSKDISRIAIQPIGFDFERRQVSRVEIFEHGDDLPHVYNAIGVG